MTKEEDEKIVTIMSNPCQFKIPDWFLTRQKDGKYFQVMFNLLHNKLCDYLERVKKIKNVSKKK